MKTIFFKTFLLLTLSIFFINCTKENTDTNTNDECTPEGLMSYEEANLLEETYKDNQYALLSEYWADANGNLFQDNREFWYSLEDLKCYLKYVEDKGSEMGYSSSEMGIRVYLGAKLEEDSTHPKTQIFFVATAGENSDGSKSTMSETDNFYAADAKDYGSSGKPPIDYDKQ